MIRPLSKSEFIMLFSKNEELKRKRKICEQSIKESDSSDEENFEITEIE